MSPPGTAVAVEVNDWFWVCATTVTEDVDDPAGGPRDTKGLDGTLDCTSLMCLPRKLRGMPSGVEVIVAPNGRGLGYDRPEAIGNPSVTSTE